MTTIYILGAVAAPVAFVAIFFYTWRAGAKPLPEEAGHSPIYQELCGARFGVTRLSRPMVRWTLYKDFLVANCGFKRYLLRYENIDSVGGPKHFGKGGVGLPIRHSAPRLPSTFILLTDNHRKIAAVLREHGVHVDAE